MIYRKSIRSDDRYGWIVAIVTTIILLPGLFALRVGWVATSTLEKVIATCIGLIFTVMFILSRIGVICPMEWELMLDHDKLRWGNTRKQSRQRCLNPSDIAALYY